MQSCYANWQLILEYLKVFLSWPVAALVLGGTFMGVFRAPIRELVNRLTRFKAIGAEFEASAPLNQEQIKPATELTDPIDIAAADPTRAKQAIAGLRELFIFEQAYNVIYGSQMSLLHYLRIQGAQGSEKADVERFFNEHQKLVGERPTTLPEYLAFLFGKQFVEYAPQDRLRITALGSRFLDHIVNTYIPPPYRPY